MSAIDCLCIYYYHLANIKWGLKLSLKKYFKKNVRRIINENRSLQNTHVGERCFIVGNGPSLSKMDLQKIHNEFVFTVNSIIRNEELYLTIGSNCHVLIDPDFNKFSDDELITFLKSVSYSKSVKYCVCSFDMINRRALFLDSGLIPIFLFQHKNWSDTQQIDLSKNVYVAQNVVQSAIYVAIYMGFKEIFLVGCDMTAFYENLEYNASGTLLNYHIYKNNVTDEKIFREYSLSRDNQYVLADYAKIFYIFKEIRKYSKEHEVKIYNATVGGVLDIFERVDYNTLF